MLGAGLEDFTMLDRLRKEDFEPLLGKTLTLQAGEEAIAFEVAQVLPINNPSPRPEAPFALILRAPNTCRAAQGIFRMDHPTHGALDLFVVPVGPDGQGMCYEVIFN
jgi:hypothetical protein